MIICDFEVIRSKTFNTNSLIDNWGMLGPTIFKLGMEVGHV